jgi:preprotein translocase subunit SecG
MAFLGTLLLVVHILIGVLMCIVILMQSSKGEGLSGAFGMGQGTSTFFGADTANVLVKITTVLAIMFMVTSLSLAYVQAYNARSVAGGQPKAETAEDLGTTPDEATTPEGGTGTTPDEATMPGGATDESPPAAGNGAEDGGTGAADGGTGATTPPGPDDTTGPQGDDSGAPQDTNS